MNYFHFANYVLLVLHIIYITSAYLELQKSQRSLVSHLPFSPPLSTFRPELLFPFHSPSRNRFEALCGRLYCPCLYLTCGTATCICLLGLFHLRLSTVWSYTQPERQSRQYRVHLPLTS